MAGVDLKWFVETGEVAGELWEGERCVAIRIRQARDLSWTWQVGNGNGKGRPLNDARTLEQAMTRAKAAARRALARL